MEKPMLDQVNYRFSQEGNCLDGGEEVLEVRYTSDLGLTDQDGGFFTIKTKQWAFDSIDNLIDILKQIKTKY